MTTYDLVAERWIPCDTLDGNREELSLLMALRSAHHLRALYHPSPLVTAALHRLLLAVLHRVYGPPSADAWHALWQAGRWDEARLTEYLDTWRPRFDLFAAERPFYQAADLDFRAAGPVAKLGLALATGSNATLFDHSWDTDGAAMTAPDSACWLVAHQAFALGGLVSFEPGQAADRAADAAPLTKGALCLFVGDTLFQTLMLNMHRYHPADEEPFPVRGDDLPAWERDVGPRAEDRAPTGYLDLLTWQSRRIRLQPDLDPSGGIVVRRCVVMKGNQFPDGFSRHGREPMLAFERRERAAAGQDPWPAVAFQPDRVVWRDSLALVQSLAERRTRPKTVTWLHDLVADGIVDRSRVVTIDLLGMAVDRAKVHLWRHERLPLPLRYLDQPTLVDALGHALAAAEAVESDLQVAANLLAQLLLAPDSDDRNARQPLRRDVTTLRDHFGAQRRYWSRLEQPFLELLHRLPDDRVEVDGEAVYGERELGTWFGTLERSATAALQEAGRGQRRSARGLKAAAKAESLLERRLRRTLDLGGSADAATDALAFADDATEEADELVPA